MTPQTHFPLAPAEFDPVSPHGFADPASMYETARREAPVFWHEGLGVWVVTRRDDVDAVLTDWQKWPSGPLDESEHLRIEVPEVARAVIDDSLISELMVTMNPPKHSLHRRAAQAAFLKPAMDALQPEIEARANALVDKFADLGEVELMNEFCLALTTQTLMALLDFPDDMTEFMQTIRDDQFVVLASGVEPMEEPRRSEVWGRYAESNLRLREIVEERRRRAQGIDVVTVMATAKDAKGEYLLTPAQIALHLNELAAAGTDTTAQAMANAVMFLSAHEDQLNEAIADPSLWGDVFEETIRRRPSAPFAARLAADDNEIGGVVIPKGDTVWVALASANTDPGAVTDGMAFDIHREDKTNYSFTKGRHTCLGAPLARVQGATGLRVLFSRIPSLRVVEEQEHSFLPLAMLPIRRALQTRWTAA
ncbi:cytochrome P450 [Microbacterium sp. LRZ72]|uniref:cytochrome P450 n=1 Tax=Microbacterium sp. LRZ72 TaxID=2942481 RepID=UPI0029A5C99A|nr:cytochrome P450 [Microbacterium sp. LRZ72]MDX2377537.1 cytochrome P450 [Microbacterium sp. LRZ72]